MHTRLIALVALILLTGCYRSVGVESNDKTQEIPMMMPQGQQGYGEHGREVTMGYGALSGTGGVNANGVVTAHFMQDKTTIVGMQLNIEVPPVGFFYEGWVQSSTGARISLGHLTNPFNDVRHQLRIESPADLRTFPIAVVTLEADDGDPAPSRPVATGILKQTRR